MKGKLMKKLKTVKQIGYLNPDRILQVSGFDGFVDNFHLKSTFVDNFPFKSHNKSHCSPQLDSKSRAEVEKPEVMDVETLMKDNEEESKTDKMSTGNDFDEKENIFRSVSKVSVCEMKKLSCCYEELEKQSVSKLGISSKELKKEGNSEIEKSSCGCKKLKKEGDSEIEKSSCGCKELKKESDSDSELEVSYFRRPDMDSGSLFDPKLLTAFEEAVEEYIRSKKSAELESNSKNHKYTYFQPEDEFELDNESKPLDEYEEKSIPG
ncbi:hypothetical protein SOVF_169440, partial [Spinacia oleracea]